MEIDNIAMNLKVVAIAILQSLSPRPFIRTYLTAHLRNSPMLINIQPQIIPHPIF